MRFALQRIGAIQSGIVCLGIAASLLGCGHEPKSVPTSEAAKISKSMDFAAAVPTTFTFPLLVTTSPSMQLNDNDADQLLAAASTDIEGNTPNSGARCKVQLLRSGHVQTSSDGVTNIQSVSDLARVCQSLGYIHQLPVIDFCGGTEDVGGCAPIGYACAVVAANSSSNQNVVIAHEYGHTKGLDHRTDANALMNSSPTLGHTVLLPSECVNMSDPLPQAKWLPSNKLMFASSLQLRAEGTSVKDFVHESSLDRFDFASAKSYGSAAVPQLISMLNSAEEKQYSPTIIKMLGLVGDDSTVDVLARYIKAGSSTISPFEYRSKTAAIISIGYLANGHLNKYSKDDGGPAIRFLTALTSPEKVDGLAGSWALDGQNRDDRNGSLIRTAILALGISGTPQAAKILTSLSSRKTRFAFDSNQSRLEDVIETAKKENQAVREKGLERYYEEK